jgi:hypothetical protein
VRLLRAERKSSAPRAPVVTFMASAALVFPRSSGTASRSPGQGIPPSTILIQAAARVLSAEMSGAHEFDSADEREGEDGIEGPASASRRSARSTPPVRCRRSARSRASSRLRT